MALTKHDLMQIQELIVTQLAAQDKRLRIDLRDAFHKQREEFSSALDEQKKEFSTALDEQKKEFSTALHQQGQDIKHDIREEMHSCINAAVIASEQRVITTLRGEIRETSLAISEIITDHVLVPLETLEKKVSFLYKHVGLSS